MTSNQAQITYQVEKTWDGWTVFGTIDNNWGITSGPFVKYKTASLKVCKSERAARQWIKRQG